MNSTLNSPLILPNAPHKKKALTQRRLTVRRVSTCEQIFTRWRAGAL